MNGNTFTVLFANAYTGGQAGPVVDPDYQAYLDKLTELAIPLPTEQERQNALVVGIKAAMGDGLARIGSLRIYAGGSLSAGMVDVKRLVQMSFTPTGAPPSYDTFRGVYNTVPYPFQTIVTGYLPQNSPDGGMTLAFNGASTNGAGDTGMIDGGIQGWITNNLGVGAGDRGRWKNTADTRLTGVGTQASGTRIVTVYRDDTVNLKFVNDDGLSGIRLADTVPAPFVGGTPTVGMYDLSRSGSNEMFETAIAVGVNYEGIVTQAEVEGVHDAIKSFMQVAIAEAAPAPAPKATRKRKKPTK